MTKNSVQPAFHRHFLAWFIALFVFAFLEWRHTGFVSYMLPFPVLVCIPGALLLVGYVFSRYCEK